MWIDFFLFSFAFPLFCKRFKFVLAVPLRRVACAVVLQEKADELGRASGHAHGHALSGCGSLGLDKKVAIYRYGGSFCHLDFSFIMVVNLDVCGGASPCKRFRPFYFCFS
jgi:hypothetical protein